MHYFMQYILILDICNNKLLSPFRSLYTLFDANFDTYSQNLLSHCDLLKQASYLLKE